ncbi:MAG: thioredoxin domain-containing protein [Methanomicrobiales archaeon]|nr:thioredoxin domain-containing protein [Methanomicrobiales archaeon]
MKHEIEGSAPQEKTNRLRFEKSPYLLQHAGNPVDWYPWGTEAFERAKREDTPVFLSIGYATCHWCHVMARESFSDPGIARMLNESFVCIKVDREERPDIDQIYMHACLLMTGRGGWPLTIVMTPDHRPFFAASYVPKESRFGMVGLLDLLPRLADVWRTRRDEVLESADSIADAIRGLSAPAEGALEESVLDDAYAVFAGMYDREHGGFGTSPKFPSASILLFMLRWWKRTSDDAALAMVRQTIEAIRSGGVFDQIGYGVHRYATDEAWRIPHFEKMLYDQAMLALACTEAFQATGTAFFRRTASELLDYALRDLRSAEGVFYSAEDAESEGEEGRYYTWTMGELQARLGREDAAVAADLFNVVHGGNFPGGASGIHDGRNILYRDEPGENIAARYGMDLPSFLRLEADIRQDLFSLRERRIRPPVDDKILADWNGLMIAALATASDAFDDTEFRNAAEQAAAWMQEHLRDANGRLLHRFRDGEAAIPGTLDDYAFFIWGLIELYAATYAPQYLKDAVSLQAQCDALFWDTENGGYFYTAGDAEPLLVRTKVCEDGAYPSGNAVAFLNLLRLARLTGDMAYESRAADCAAVFAGQVMQAPASHAFFLCGLDFARGPTKEVVVVGPRDNPDTQRMLAALRAAYLPRTIVVWVPAGEGSVIREVAPYTGNLTMQEGKATAYVCHKFRCIMPTTSIEAMLGLIREIEEG